VQVYDSFDSDQEKIRSKRVFRRKWLLVAILLETLLCAWQEPAFGQENPMTADQLIANYVQAIGGSEKIASITTLVEKGELSGNFAGFEQRFAPPTARKDRGTFEFNFKAPNLRSYVLHSDNNTVLTMRGCDGTVAWYIGADAVPHEFKPKPGSEYECSNGYDPMPPRLRAPNVRLQLKGKKKVGDRIAWVVRAQDPKSPWTDVYSFDAETYLLLRWESFGSSNLSSQGPESKVDRSYSDYRDVGGIKLPFMVVQHADSSSLVTIFQEAKINAPLDDAAFQEPKILDGSKHPHVLLASPPKNPQIHPEPRSGEIAAATIAPSVAHTAPVRSEVVTSNFISASVAELRQIVPELRGLKPGEGELALPELLDKIGERTVELSRKIPNLIAREEVVEAHPGARATREDFSYLILARLNKDGLTLDEFRVDLKTGAMLETDDAWKPQEPAAVGFPSHLDDLALASQRINARTSGGPPLSEGFASMWIRFHPSNRSESTFRYLGQQKIDGHHTFVLAFAQKPGSVRLPAEVRFQDKSVPIYYQGIAWVDVGDFRIVRLRTDLLSTTNLPLTRLTSEVQFAETRATGFATPLWLPRDVVVTSQVSGNFFYDRHSYSNYRSFQAHAKILLDP
jgi:hypothetical protein